MLHASHTPKIEYPRYSLRQLVKSNSTSFNDNSIIRTTIIKPKKDVRQTTKNFAGNLNNTQSTRQRQNIFRYPTLTQSTSKKLQKTPLYRSITQSQLNNWNNNGLNQNIQSSVSFTSTQKYFHRNDFKNECPIMWNERKKQQRFKKHFPCSWSMPCVLVSLLISLLLIGAILGSILGVFFGFKTTSTSTTLSVITVTATVTPTACSCLCPNESWTFDSDRLARWSFDGTFTDTTNMYNVTSYNAPSLVPDGYVNQALLLNASLIQSLSTSYIPLAYTSFTIEVWLKPTLFPNLYDHSILGLCPSPTPYQCLHLVIRKINSNSYLYFGFFADDCQGNTSLTLNQWIHAAFVFDITTLTQSIYLNGILDNRCITSSPIIAEMGSVTIGTVPAIIPLFNMNFYQGYIDHLTITKRAKSSCEILEDATLVSCFLFDAATPNTDFGPNSLLNSELSTSVVSSGHSHEAISFNGTAYFQASSFTALGFVNKSFSIVLWIRPQSVWGTIVHISALPTGKGWCFPFLGMALNGSIVAQIFNNGAVTIWGPSIPMTSVWSHMVQTWSSTNGLRLYIDNVLVAFDTSAVNYAASGLSNFVTLASSRSGNGYCGGGGLGFNAPAPLKCDIDDWRVYNRELTASDVSTIYYS